MKQVILLAGIGLIGYAIYNNMHKKGCGCKKSADPSVVKDQLGPSTVVPTPNPALTTDANGIPSSIAPLAPAPDNTTSGTGMSIRPAAPAPAFSQADLLPIG